MADQDQDLTETDIQHTIPPITDPEHQEMNPTATNVEQRPTRTRTQTKRDLAYQIETKTQVIKDAINHWRKQVEFVYILVTDCKNIESLKTERDALGKVLFFGRC